MGWRPRPLVRDGGGRLAQALRPLEGVDLVEQIEEGYHSARRAAVPPVDEGDATPSLSSLSTDTRGSMAMPSPSSTIFLVASMLSSSMAAQGTMPAWRKRACTR